MDRSCFPGGDSVVWDSISPPQFPNGRKPAVTSPDCVLPQCNVEHKPASSLVCAECGRRGSSSCLKNKGKIPSGVLHDFLVSPPQNWVCPVCAWIEHANRERPPLLTPLHTHSDSDSDSSSCDIDMTNPTNMEAVLKVFPPKARRVFDHMLGLFEAVKAELVRTRKRLDKLEADQKKQLSSSFSPFVVSTWEGVEHAAVRKEIRASVGKAFSEFALPANKEDAQDWQRAHRNSFSVLENLMDSIPPDTPPHEGILRALHNTIVRHVCCHTGVGPFGCQEGQTPL